MRHPIRHARTFGLRRFVAGRVGHAFAVLACWALLLQSVVPLVHTPAALLAEGSSPGWALASLCHAGPEQDATAERSSDPAGKHAPNGQAPVCQVCLGLHLAGTFAPPRAVELPLPRAAGVVAAPCTETVAVRSTFRSVAQARAPPLDS